MPTGTYSKSSLCTYGLILRELCPWVGLPPGPPRPSSFNTKIFPGGTIPQLRSDGWVFRWDVSCTSKFWIWKCPTDWWISSLFAIGLGQPSLEVLGAEDMHAHRNPLDSAVVEDLHSPLSWRSKECISIHTEVKVPTPSMAWVYQ